ncbi:uro-adherence factor A-like isoform X2 [Palaemon carinicauda]|uniref:uro-adherence factor A-like isoform X2 n=1 Tax=Palaemon carinicauda TaxID=392227 RepID=UPI0035B642BD
MSEIENITPSEMKGQFNKGKESSKIYVDGSKTPRTPFKDIGNKSLNKTMSPLKEKGVSPTKFEAIQSLDEEENWRDRTEVVTKLEHTAYKIMAREIVEEAIEKLPGMRESSQTPAELKFSKMAFRERPSKNMDDSVLDLDETISLPQLDDTIILPRMESKLNVPVANSTLLNTTCTSPRSPNQSDTVFENSLLSSFEKMQIKGAKGPLADDDEEDIFHDASDHFDSFSTSPVKNQKSPISKQAAEQMDDPFDMLMSCMEKITVNDKDRSILAEKDETIDSVESAQLPPSHSKGIPGNVEDLEVEKSKVKIGPVVDVDNKVYEEKKDFKDPDFNPFLTKTSTSSNTNSEEGPKVSPVGVMLNEERVISSSDINQECNLSKVDANKSTQSISEITDDRSLKESQDLRKVLNTEDNNDLKTHLSQSSSPNTEALLGNLEEKSGAIPAAKHTEDSQELQHKRCNSETLEDCKFEQSQTTDVNLANLAAPRGENTSKDMVIQPNSEEASIVLPKRSYDVDRIMKLSDDPSFNPFAPQSCIVNSPDLQSEIQGKEDAEVSKTFDYAVKGLKPVTENVPPKKDYSFVVALDKIQDPNFDPFLPKNLIVNSPDLVDEDLFNTDDASKTNGDNVTKSQPNCESEVTACKTDHTETNIASGFVIAEASTGKSKVTDAVSEKSSSEKSNDISTKLPTMEKPVSQDDLEGVISPKRKYDEAFTGEMKDYDEELLAMKEVTGASEGGNEENIDDKASEQETEEVVSESQQEEIIPSQKGCKLNFLDKLDDSNFDPFTTKTSVTNSPGNEPQGSKPIETAMLKNEDPVITKSEEPKTIASCEKEVTSETEEVVSESQQEEIIPPKKGYNLDFLDEIDDSNFDPFTTKTSVTNSPGTEPQGSKPIKTTMLKKKEPVITKSVEPKAIASCTKEVTSVPNVNTSEMTTTVKEISEMDVISCTLQKSVDKENNINTSDVSSKDSNEMQTKEEENASVPVHQVDTRDNLNISTKLPTEEKPLSQDNPGVVSPKRKYEEAFTGEMEDCDEELLAMKEAVGSSEGASEETMDAKSSEQVTEEPVSESPEEEIIPPKKGYDLDFLDKLDDANFDPFTTKTSVTNSPGTEPRESKPIKTAMLKKKDPVITKSVKSKAIASCKKEGTSDSNVNRSEMTRAVEEVSGKDLNSSALQKHINNGNNLNMSESSKNSSKAQNKEENTPIEEGSTIPSEETEASHKSEEKVSSQTTQASDKSGMGKARILKKAVKPSVKKVPFVKSEVEANQVNLDEKQEEEIPLPKKAYQLDFLDNLDDPNFNPFATKTAVANSPEKNKVSNTAQKQETAVEEAKLQNKEENTPKEEGSTIPSEETEASHKSEEKVSLQTTQASDKSGMGKARMLKKAVKPSVKKVPFVNSKVEANQVNLNEKQEEEIPLPKKAYQLDFLDNLDDPNFNPFATKTAVANSPGKNKVSNSAQKQETAVEEAKLQNKGKQTSEADVVQESEIKAKSEASIGHENNSKVEQLQEPFSGASKSKQEKEQCVEKKAESISVPGEGYQLDNTSDPNFNPFQSKNSVANTPKKVSFATFGGETTAIGPMESKQGSADEEEKLSNNLTVKKSIKSATSELCPTEKSSYQPSTKPISQPIESSASDDMFDSITKEAMRLVAQVTPVKQPTDKKLVQASAQVRQRDVFSPQFAQSGVSEDPSGAYNFDEFVDATDFFNNPEDLDALSEHGKDGDKLNLVRNSLYVKFDPLVSGRQSLAPYLAQQKIMQNEESDPRRSSALMCFSPSPDKTKRGGNAKGTGTPVKPLFKTRADETVVMDATTNMTLNETTVCEGHNNTVVAPSSSTAFNTTIISQGGNFHDDTLFQEPTVPGVKMIPEREMLKKIKEIEQTAELIMQDKLLRQSRVLEEVNREMKQQMEESEIALAGMEEENSNLRTTIQQLQAMLLKVVEQGKKKSEEGERDLFLLENKYDLECKALKEEVKQHQEELRKVEGQFHDLIKKYMRLQEVTETMRRNEEVLKAEKEALHAKLAKKEESFTTVLKTLEEKYNDAQQEFQKEKGKHEHENARLIVLVKKAEVKILSLTETVEKKSTEIQRLTALIDDITSKFG